MDDNEILVTENTQEIGQEMVVKSALKSDKMRHMPVGKLLFTMSLPAVISMMVQALYNIVDSLYVSHIPNYGQDAIDAVAIAFPIAMIVNSLAIGIGVGANATIARKLGERNQKDADGTAKTAIIIAFCSWIVIAILGLLVSRTYITTFVNSQEGYTAEQINRVIENGIDYLTVYTVASLGVFMELTCIRILQSTGNMKVPMISQLAGALCNIVLDPVFIFTLNMGVKGAAIATVISQWVAGGIGLITLFMGRQDVNISLRGFRPRAYYFREIARIGIPTFLMNAVMSFTTIILQSLLGKYSGGITILAIYGKLQSFVYMIVFGMTQGATPILAYNYGANNRARFDRTVKIALCTASIILGLGMVVFLTIPHTLIGMFGGMDSIQDTAAHAFRIISLAFIPSSLGIMIVTIFQSLGKAVHSMAISITRTVGLVVPLAFILDMLWGLSVIWWCYVMAEVLSILIFLPICIRTINKQFIRKQLQYQTNTLTST
ncbi:MAG: MATE family efflux transporter [Clostridia bacterium]|nr:MATE family efflux transporter [Clostridia bacterium]